MTELTWTGKYRDGQKVAPVRIALPFQTIETVNESAADRAQRLGSLFSDKPDTGAWTNRLIWGDKKYVLPSLLPEFAGKVDLIYIDPPFNVGADFSFTATIPDHPDSDGDDGASFLKQPSIIEQKAYRDTWGRGLDSYLQWFYETVVVLRELLSENGSIYVHIDWHVGHYAKVVLDEVFGIDRFQNEIIWQRTDSHNDARKRFGAIHDVIFWYAKSDSAAYYSDDTRTDLSPSALAEYSLLELPDGRVIPYKGNEAIKGRRFKLDDATWKSNKSRFEWRGATPSLNRGWRYPTVEEMDLALERKELYLRDPAKGALRCKKSYLDGNKGLLLQDIWTDAGRMKGGSRYATEKPEPLLERIITASSRKGNLILDCFCGSGTTAAVAEKMGRRWITCDLGRFSIHTARKRFLGIEGVKPFHVQNLGKYERQQWVKEEFAQPQDRLAQEQAYRHFILNLYHAQPLLGHTWLHGAKAGRLVHVGSVEAPVSAEDVRQMVQELWRITGKEKKATKAAIDVLGWEFSFDLNETAVQSAAENKVDLHFWKIPREVLEKKAVEQGDIKFYELAYLDVATKVKGREVTLELKDFIISPDDVPEEVRGKITHWSQWVDYWAVDWDHQDDSFHNTWQSYRTRKDPKLELKAAWTYEQKGEHAVVVKVIDILGNDTTKRLVVKVG